MHDHPAITHPPHVHDHPHGRDHPHRHGHDAGDPTAFRLVTGPGPASTVVHLSPSFLRMGVAGRTAIAAALAAVVWIAVLSVIG
jgi:hypothetical protein